MKDLQISVNGLQIFTRPPSYILHVYNLSANWMGIKLTSLNCNRWDFFFSGKMIQIVPLKINELQSLQFLLNI